MEACSTPQRWLWKACAGCLAVVGLIIGMGAFAAVEDSAEEGIAEHAIAEESAAEEGTSEESAEVEAIGARETAETDPLSFPPEIEALLNESSSAEEYTERERCINTRSVRNTEVLDDRHIVFELSSKRYYLVQFKHRCFRLRPRSTVIYETRSNQLCRLDAIRAGDGSMLSSTDIGPPCSIPGFIPVEPEQIALLKESLKAQRQAARQP